MLLAAFTAVSPTWARSPLRIYEFGWVELALHQGRKGSWKHDLRLDLGKLNPILTALELTQG